VSDEGVGVGSVTAVTTPDPQAFWGHRYRTADVGEVSWYEPVPNLSLAMMQFAGVTADAAVVDVGGGASALTETLWERGHRDLTVLDASAAAMAVARARWEGGDTVTWVAADLLAWEPGRTFDVWHDRAVSHFLTNPTDRARYAGLVRRAVRPGGVVTVAGFADDGPMTCSGLDVARRSPEDLLADLGAGFTEVGGGRYLHTTPSGAVQQFSWVVARRTADDGSID
jgi:SAM-dependent methyltransferase